MVDVTVSPLAVIREVWGISSKCPLSAALERNAPKFMGLKKPERIDHTTNHKDD
jgi:hypothetical protein